MVLKDSDLTVHQDWNETKGSDLSIVSWARIDNENIVKWSFIQNRTEVFAGLQ
jgi:hypothetical protein